MAWRSTLLGACALVGCGSGNIAPPTTVDLAPSVAPVPTLLPPRESARDQGCPIVLNAIAAAESDCPDRAFSRASLEKKGTHDQLEICAKRIEDAKDSLHDQDILDSAMGAVFATRMIGRPEVAQASAEAEAALAGSHDASTSSTDPAFVVALRKRAYAYASTRDWCAIARRQTPPDTWTNVVDPMLLGLQPQFSACAAEARQRSPLRTGTLTMNWRAVIEVSGRPRLVAPIDFPSGMRADLVLCLLQVVERTAFPPPERGDAVVGSNVTFVEN